MKNIMLIDDDMASHAFHRLMIQSAGFDLSGVKSCHDVDEALAMLKELAQDNQAHWPDCIIVDRNMPLKSGFDFVREFEEQAFDLKVPAIYLVSSSKNPRDEEKVTEIDLIKGFETKFLKKDFFEALRENSTDPTA